VSRKLKETPPTPLALVANLFFLLDRLWCSDLFEQLVSNRRLGGLEEYRRRAVALVSIQADCPEDIDRCRSNLREFASTLRGSSCVVSFRYEARQACEAGPCKLPSLEMATRSQLSSKGRLYLVLVSSCTATLQAIRSLSSDRPALVSSSLCLHAVNMRLSRDLINPSPRLPSVSEKVTTLPCYFT